MPGTALIDDLDVMETDIDYTVSLSQGGDYLKINNDYLYLYHYDEGDYEDTYI